MTNGEKEALLMYVDSQVMAMCQSIEKHVDPDAVGTLWEQAYDLIEDLERTLQSQIELQEAEDRVAKNKKS